MRRLLSIAIALTLVGMANAVGATQSHLEKLPATTPFRCLNCHTVQDPNSSNASLNAFGRDFKNNGFKWDRTLAEMHSDGDSCTNGFELGDQDGDGRLDAGVTVERHNPGVSDCTLQLSKQAWSNLKELFR